jgi:hypothetical protein
MASRRALVYQAGTLGLVCAAYEVEIDSGGQDRAGTITPVRDCTELATEVLEGPDGSQTGLCLACRDVILAYASMGTVHVQRAQNN